MDELKVKHADTSEVNRLQQHLDGVQSRLQEAEGKLEKSTKDLSKEQARNKSAAKHNQVNNIFMLSILSIKITDRQQGNFYFYLPIRADHGFNFKTSNFNKKYIKACLI